MSSRLPPLGSPSALYLFDLSSWVHRFWHVGAVASRMFIEMLERVWAERRPQLCAIAADNPWPTFRHRIMEDFASLRGLPASAHYKANRKLPTADRVQIMEQCRLASEMADDLLGVRTFSVRGYEADDVIATITQRALRDGLAVIIASTDKDLSQLCCDDRVWLWDTKSGLVRAPEVEEKFGVGPALLGDYLALVGDVADNIPGVRGVGPKAAVTILREAGGLGPALQAAAQDDVRVVRNARHRALLRDGAEVARLSRQLVELAQDVPLSLARFDELRCGW